MKYGVNYTPSHDWFYFWLHPEWDSVARDLDAIASLGMDHIRIFPLWPVLQPNRTWINQAGLEDLRHMALLADERGLDVYSDVIQGHMSSFDFVPSWLLSWHDRNMFTDEAAVEAQCQLISAVYHSLEDLPHFAGLTIGNECNQFTDQIHPQRMRATSSQVHDWLDKLLEPLREKALKQKRVLLHCENDAVWYQDEHAFLPCLASNQGDMTCIHSWVFNGTAQNYGALSEESTRHAEYLIELSKAFSEDPHRPVWLQEIGAPLNVMEEDEAPDFCRSSIRFALECADLFGITWWCSHDINDNLHDFPSFEHRLGLFDQEGKLKCTGRVFQEMAAIDCDMPQASRKRTALVVDSDESGDPVPRSACSPGGSIFCTWMDMSRQGSVPAMVSSQMASNPDLLAARGITDCIRIKVAKESHYAPVSDLSLKYKKQRDHE